ncbi:MAG: stage III sporulation protein AE [Clostridia bacterium]|nr:stage III sporulation protein AE [Clostridia bacterium]
MIKKIFIIFVVCITLFSLAVNVYAVDVNDVAEELDMNSLIDTLKEYTDDEIDIESMAEDLITGEGVNYGVIGNFVVNKLFYEIRVGLKSCISVLIVIILMAIVKGIELEKDSTVSKVTSLVGFLVIVTIILKSYFTMVKLFTDTVMILTQIMEIVAPFMLAILIATGEITTSGILGPVLLFVTSLVGVLVTYIILPLLSASLVFKIISNMSDGLKVDKLSKMFSSTAMWVVGVVFALFLGIMELESSVTTSIDEVTVKTTQAAVSNLIPVVGKFVSDSLEVVMGASEIIGKTVGVIGIVVMILVALIPIIKIIIHGVMYFILSAISELLNTDGKITDLCASMSKQYKTMLGIMLGVMVTFVIGIGIVINLMGKVVG